MPVRYNWKWNKHDHIRQSARSIGHDRSLYFSMLPWTPPTVNMEGDVTYYDPKRIETVRKRLKGVNKKRYLSDIVSRLLKPDMDTKRQVATICDFVSNAIYYNPIEQPADGTGENDLVVDPVELLELHDGRCGQGVIITNALLNTAGIESRQRDVFHHVTCEAKYGGKWHLADALMFGSDQPEKDGEVVNVAFLQKNPYFADSRPLRCFAYTPEELMSQDGYRLLGYAFGDWGSLTYYSWYMGGAEEYPPTMPVYLFPKRLKGDQLHFQWPPSAKRNGGTIRYRFRIYLNRKRTETIFDKTTQSTSLKWSVPERNRMYFVGIQATDDHVKKNPDTWYPEAVGNFVLVPPDQYGWYGVL